MTDRASQTPMTSSMTREELWRILEMLPIVAKKAELLERLVKAQEEGGHATLPEFIYSPPMLPSYKAPPALSIVKGDTLEAFFEEIRNSKYRFEDCFDPAMLVEFIDPNWGNGSLRYEDMTDGQKRTVRLIKMKYRQWRQNNIERDKA